jgi:hypothetical protein
MVILKVGVDVDLKDEYGNTSLILASQKDHT